MNNKIFIVTSIILSAALTISLIGLFKLRKKVEQLEDDIDLEKGNTAYNKQFNDLPKKPHWSP